MCIFLGGLSCKVGVSRDWSVWDNRRDAESLFDGQMPVRCYMAAARRGGQWRWSMQTIGCVNLTHVGLHWLRSESFVTGAGRLCCRHGVTSRARVVPPPLKPTGLLLCIGEAMLSVTPTGTGRYCRQWPSLWSVRLPLVPVMPERRYSSAVFL